MVSFRGGGGELGGCTTWLGAVMMIMMGIPWIRQKYALAWLGAARIARKVKNGTPVGDAAHKPAIPPLVSPVCGLVS